MTQTTNTDVFIVGAGPVGMTAASELTRWGVSIRIVDKKTGPVEHSHAVGVHVRTQEVLDAMGIVAGWEANGYRQSWLAVHAFGKRLGVVRLDGIDSPHSGMLSIGQNVTERLLLEHLQSIGVTVERPVEAIDFHQDNEGATVTLRHADGREEVAHARWVISCEGSRSMVREKLGIPFEGARYDAEVFVQSDAILRWSYPIGTYAFLDRDLAVILSPYNTDGLYRIICAMPDPDPSNHNPPTLEEIEQLVRQGADPDAQLSDPQWLTRYRTQHRGAERFRDGRAFLAGDTGHVHVPLAGQGMNTGMQDAFNLCWKLAAVIHGVAKPELLDSYNIERHPVAEALLKGTDQAFHTLITPSNFMEWSLKTLGPLALNAEALQNKLRVTVEELNIAYRHSSIVEDRGGSSGPVAGDRAPGAIVVKDKQTTYLFDVLRGTHWTLLLFGGVEPTDEDRLLDVAQTITDKYGDRITVYFVVAEGAPYPNWQDSCLMDREHFLHNKYGATNGCIYLIRPDWYIGFRSKLSEGDRLLTYLAQIFL